MLALLAATGAVVVSWLAAARPVSATAAAPLEGRTVTRIDLLADVSGISRDRVRPLIVSRVGDVFRQDDLARTLRNLQASGLVSEAEVFVESVPEGVVNTHAAWGRVQVERVILRGDLQFTLVDRSQRKIRFVTQVRRTLSLANVRALCVEVEELPSVARLVCVVSRGVTELQRLWELAAPRLRSTPSTTGVLVAMASTRGEASATQIEPELPGGRVFARPVIRIPGSADGHRLDVVEMVEMQGPSGNGD